MLFFFFNIVYVSVVGFFLVKIIGLKAVSESKSSSEMSGVSKEEEKSDEYSQDMTQAMGAGKSSITIYCMF